MALLVVAALTCAAGRAEPAVAGVQPVRPIAGYPGLSRIFRELSRDASQASAGRVAADLFDFEQVVMAVAGPGAAVGAHSYEEYRAAFAGTADITIPVDRGVLSRDDTAYRLHSLGYSPKEIADMLAGRITRAALDSAQKMLMLGYEADRVSDFLDREYRRLEAARAASAPPVGPTFQPPVLVGDAVARYAARYGVDPLLVGALIACESRWNVLARSRAGAIGLMQLMPGTARQLGVNPYDPRQNVEGGIRYLAILLRMFGRVDHALIAYNAGPGFADRYVHGQAALYGETREFVNGVLGQMALRPRQPRP